MPGIRSQIIEAIKRGPLNAPYLLLCEGKGDAWFFHRLFSAREIVQFDIDISLVQDDGKTGAGSSRFGQYLEGLRTEILLNPGKLEAIIIMTDNDANPEASYKNVQKQIRDVGDFGVPSKPFELVVSAQSFPSVMIVTLPEDGQPGALEHLCIPAACDVSKHIVDCLPDVMKCCGAETWGAVKQAKMQLRMLIASSWRDDPNISLATLWERDSSQHLIPVTHPCFDKLAQFFKDFKIG